MYRHISYPTYLVFLSVLMTSGPGQAQVPRFEQTPYSLLNGLRSMDVTTRRTSAASLSRFRKSREALKALTKALYSDPDVSVRQNAATSLSKHGSKGRQALVRGAV